MNKLQELLAKLDQKLTGKSWIRVCTTSRNSAIKDAHGWLFGPGHDHCYYLSDGGYSRVKCDVIIDDPPKIFLTSNSRQEVKDKWDECKDLRAEIEQEIYHYLWDLTGNKALFQ